MAQCEGPCAQMVRPFLVFIYIWLEDIAKLPLNPQVQGASRNVNPAQFGRLLGETNTWLVGVNHLLYHFSITIRLHFASFYSKKYFKNSAH